MKIRFVVVLIVVSGLVGCGNSSVTPQANLGTDVVIATVNGGSKVLTYNESLDIVCVENAQRGVPAGSTWAAFSCWETSVAPKKMQELVVRYLSGKK